MIGAARKTDGADLYWRIAQFLMPNHAYAPAAFPGEVYYGQCWVPVDDMTCWIYTYSWLPDRPLSNAERTKFDGGFSVHAEVDADYVPLRNLRNDYLIDRAVQKTTSFTGIAGVSEQDAAIQDSQGPIQDRTTRASRADRRRHRRVPQAPDGRRPRLQQGVEPKSTACAKKYAVRAGGWIADPGQGPSRR